MPDLDLQGVIDAFMVHAAIVDETGEILLVNKAWLDFGARNDGQSDRVNTGANYFATVEKAAAGGDVYAQMVRDGIENIINNNITEFELEYPCHSKTTDRWFLVNIKEIGDIKPRKFLFTHKDVSGLVERERRVRAAQRLEAIGQLAGGIAHDFNNILSILMGNLQLIQSKVKDDSPIRENLKLSLIAVQRGASLVQKLLLLSRDYQLSVEDIDANEFIRETLKIIGRTLGEDIDIVTQYAAGPLPVRVESSALSSAILNIAINARHAMPSGGTLTIRTSCVDVDGKLFMTSTEKVYGSYVVISITDTGCGISQENLGRILEPFFTTRDVGKGSGLGLSMVSGFIKQSNGHLDIDSRVGEGTTVSLYLPVNKKTAWQQNRSTTAGTGAIKGKIVLLVEDSDQVRMVYKHMLEDLGCRVIEAQNGRVALDILLDQGENIDIVLADIVMPGGISGLDLAKEIRDSYPNIKVMLTSGYPDKHYQQYASAHNVTFPVPLLNKPFSIEDLVEALQNLYESADK